jgi:Zn-finger nucleic acid-binding protein
MKCPNCSEFLVMADKNGVEIDYCPKCRGIWLDKGELEKIMERTNQHYTNRDNYERDYHSHGKPQSSHNEKHYDKNYVPRHDDGHYPHKKKKSFFDDFFDFD